MIPSLRYLLVLLLLTLGLGGAQASDEFFGPFADWANLQRDYGATGNGVTDDGPALQRALNEIGNSGKPNTLWIPAGTYRIATPVTMTARQGVAIFGESPETTVLRWAGTGPVMLKFLGVGYSRHGRFTCDGMGKDVTLIHETWDGGTGNYVSVNEYTDVVFANATVGLDIGQPHFGDAETAVNRCVFTHCGTAARVNSFNSLDWWFWHCRFDDCNQGVDIVAGHCHVYGSVFHRSTWADIVVECGGYMSFRGNHSFDSRCFYEGYGIGANSTSATLQDNVIIDPTDIAINVDAIGPIMLIDNSIRSRAGQVTAVRLSAGNANCISIGNRLTIANAFAKDSAARLRQLDDRVVDPTTIDATDPALPPTPTPRNAPLYTVPAGATGPAVQAIIDRAVANDGGNRPLVRFAAATYMIAQTLVLPPDADVQLIGDSMLTGAQLEWQGPADGTLLRLLGPSRVGISDLLLKAYGSTAIQVTEADQTQGRVWANQLYSDCDHSNLSVEQLTGTRVEIINYGHSTNLSTDSASVAIDNATCSIFGGASSNIQSAYTVDGGGRLLVQDMWYETGSAPTFVKLTGRGDFCLSGARVAAVWDDTKAAFEFDGFRGNAAILNAQMNGRIVVQSSCGSEANVLFAGIEHDGRSDVLQNLSPTARVALTQNRFYNNGSWDMPDVGTIDDSFLRASFDLMRTLKPSAWPLASVPSGATDVRVNRVTVYAGKGLSVTGGDSTPTTAAPSFSPVGGTYSTGQSVTLTSSTVGASIRYTLDGSTPTTTSGLIYAGPIAIATNTTVHAIAYSDGVAPSRVTSAVYTIGSVEPTAAAPVFNPTGGTFTSAQMVTISSATAGASIRYTLDGSTPTPTSGSLSSGPISVSTSATIRALAFGTGLSPSAVVSADYTIGTAAVTETRAAHSHRGCGSGGGMAVIGLVCAILVQLCRQQRSGAGATRATAIER